MTVEIDGANNIVKTNTISEVTSANGVTVDGLNIKDSKLVTANSVIQTNITDQSINEAKMQISNAPTNGYALTAQSGNTGGMTWATVGETNQPVWFGRKGDSADQVLTRATNTKITSMTSDEIDTNSSYSSSRFTVPSGHAGKYFIHGSLVADFTGVGSDGEEIFAYIYKNGSQTLISGFSFDPGGKFLTVGQNVSGIIDLAVDDYVELYGRLTDDNASGNAQVSGGKGTNFGGFKISA
jgi:hypothetical protein